MAAINVSQTKNIQNAINNIKEHFKLFKSKDNTSSEGYYEVGSVKLLQLQYWVEIKLLNTLLHDKWGPMTDAIEGSIDKNIKMLVVVWELVQDNVVRMVSSAQLSQVTMFHGLSGAETIIMVWVGATALGEQVQTTLMLLIIRKHQTRVNEV